MLPETNWSQEQQRLLETAMTKYPRTCEGDRWALVAKCVPNKTKEECLDRYKHLVKMLKSQKAQEKQVEDAAKQAEAERQRVDAVNAAESEDNQSEAEKSKSPSATAGGKKRNRRKEKKRNMNFSSDEEDEED